MVVLKSGMGAITRRRFLDFLLISTFLSVPFLHGSCTRHSSSTETGSNLRTETESEFDPQVKNELVPFRWEVSAADVDTVKNSLQFQGEIKPDTDTKGAGFILVGVVLLVVLAKVVLDLVRSMKYGGIIMDARGGEILIKNDVRLPAGVIVIVDQEGTKLHKLSELDTASDLVTLLLKALGKSR